jgi:formamidopyrimidine-DNA glycosylase
VPELPEVESVRRGLQTWAQGARVDRVRILDARILGTTSNRLIAPEAPARFTAELSGSQLASVERRGKFMWLPLRGGGGTPAALPESAPADPPVTAEPPTRALSVHLGMSGQFRIHDAADPMHRHTRAILDLERAGRQRLELRFVDQRIFGHLGIDDLVESHGALAPRSASHIALDPLHPLYDPERTARRIQAKRTGMKAALLDQTVVSGIGNIYADEALFAARVHPLAPTRTTRISRIRAVLAEAAAVMRDSLAQGGTSFDALYVHVNGESGYFERSLNVYGREGHPCKRCGTPIARERFMNRSSHFCPICQRKR